MFYVFVCQFLYDAHVEATILRLSHSVIITMIYHCNNYQVKKYKIFLCTYITAQERAYSDKIYNVICTRTNSSVVFKQQCGVTATSNNCSVQHLELNRYAMFP